MEEADALCTRIAILCGGKLEALGSQVHLKNKFSVGLKLTLITNVTCLGDLNETGHIQKMITSETEVLAKLEKIVQEFLCQNAVLEQKLIHYHIPKNNWHSTAIFVVPVSGKGKAVEVFSKIDQFCKANGIIEWGFSQTSLEDVYVKVVLASAGVINLVRNLKTE
jgi:ABC-type multidrug transport system ATPase subunit